MTTTRLVLPFTHGVHTSAIEYAVLLAQISRATLVPLALIPVPKECDKKGARLECIQEAKDFFGVVSQKAGNRTVPVEQSEVFTSDVVESIQNTVKEKECEDVLLFMENGKGILLNTNEIKHVVSNVDSRHHIIHLYTDKVASPSFLKLLSHLLVGQSKKPVFVESELP